MPTSPDFGCDLLDVYVQLACTRGAALPAQALRERFGKTIDQLIAVHAFEAARPMTAVKCSACHEDHSSEVIYDSARQRSWIFCPEAGRVWVDNRELATVQLVAAWLPDQLTRALNIAPRPPLLTLIERAAWLLGDAVVGVTKISVALAVGIKAVGELNKLAGGLARRTPLDIGILVVADCHLPERFGQSSGYCVVALDDVATVRGSSFVVDSDRLHAWVRSLLRKEGRPKRSRIGRPPLDVQVLRVFEARRRRQIPYGSGLGEARAIRSEWTLLFPDTDPPSLSTVRKHLPNA